MLTESPVQIGDEPALSDALTPEARELTAFLACAFGRGTLAVIHYGSRAQGRRTRAESAFDFFVVVSSYTRAYRSLAATAGLHRPVGVATGLAQVLAPNVVSLRRRIGDRERTAKVAVLSERDFRRETSMRARDHFTQGRLMQHIVVAWVRDARCGEMINACVRRVRERTFVWGRPFLPPEFDTESYCRALLAQSLQGEIRPERADHAGQLVAAQRQSLTAVYAPLLEDLADRGLLRRAGSRYSLIESVGPLERARVRFYFRRSKTRNTVRLFKHVALYHGWLDYIIEKIARSSGDRIHFSERERRWPLVFGWPKFIRYLRTRPQRRD